MTHQISEWLRISVKNNPKIVYFFTSTKSGGFLCTDKSSWEAEPNVFIKKKEEASRQFCGVWKDILEYTLNLVAYEIKDLI